MSQLKFFFLLLFCSFMASKALEIQNENSIFNPSTSMNKHKRENPQELSTTFPSEFTSENAEEISIYQRYNYDEKNKNIFSYNYNDTSFNEFLLVVRNNLKEGTITIKGPKISLNFSLRLAKRYTEFNFSLNEAGLIYFKFENISIKGEFSLIPLKRKINIWLLFTVTKSYSNE